MNTGTALCGGGIRGIISTECVIKREKDTGKLFKDTNQYIAGTSTGALQTLAIACGIPGTGMQDVYTGKSDKIFTPTGILAQAKRFAKGYMYDPKRLDGVLSELMGDKKDITINECPIDVCISAVSASGKLWYFVKDKPTNSKLTGNVKLRDAAIASACAPTFHDHWTFKINGKNVTFFDGGVGGVANPIYQMCVEMFEYDRYIPAETKTVTLGTGFYPADENNVPEGLLNLIGWSTSTLIDTSQDWMDDATELKWPGVNKKFNWQLTGDISEDDIADISTLVAIGKKAAETVVWPG